MHIMGAIVAQALSVEDRKWRAQDDARTLAEAKVINEDTARLDAAKAAAQVMADEQAEKAKAMRSVAGRKGRTDQTGTNSRTKGRSSDVDHVPTPATPNPHNVFNKV